MLKGLAGAALLMATGVAGAAPANRGLSNHGAEHRLPLSLPPEIWAWSTGPASSDGYKESLDLIADHSNFGFLTTKAGSDVTAPETHDHVKRVAGYVHSRGVRLAVDLDIRRARGAFYKQHPGEQQWMLRIRSFPRSTPLTMICAARSGDSRATRSKSRCRVS